MISVNACFEDNRESVLIRGVMLEARLAVLIHKLESVTVKGQSTYFTHGTDLIGMCLQLKLSCWS